MGIGGEGKWKLNEGRGLACHVLSLLIILGVKCCCNALQIRLLVHRQQTLGGGMLEQPPSRPSGIVADEWSGHLAQISPHLVGCPLLPLLPL